MSSSCEVWCSRQEQPSICFPGSDEGRLGDCSGNDIDPTMVECACPEYSTPVGLNFPRLGHSSKRSVFSKLIKVISDALKPSKKPDLAPPKPKPADPPSPKPSAEKTRQQVSEAGNLKLRSESNVSAVHHENNELKYRYTLSESLDFRYHGLHQELQRHWVQYKTNRDPHDSFEDVNYLVYQWNSVGFSDINHTIGFGFRDSSRQTDEEDSIPFPLSNITGRDINVQKRTARKETTAWVNGHKVSFNWGTYKSGEDAHKDKNIDKYYYLKDNAKCGSGIGIKTFQNYHRDFQNDHVFEVQTVSQFFAWLGDGTSDIKIGKTRKPDPEWVSDVLLREESPHVYKLVRPGRLAADRQAGKVLLATPPLGETIDNIIAYGNARSDRLPADHRLTLDKTARNFAMVQDSVNLRKGVFFGRSKPGATSSKGQATANVDREWIRSHAAVFEYLGYKPSPGETGEAIWNKWMRVSNWIDLVLHEFNNEYPWGHGNLAKLEPARDDKANPSLRSFYACWIDEYLSSIEKTAEKWAEDAKAGFYKKHGRPTTKDEQLWWKKAFDKGGFATKEKLRFPRVSGAGSPFGAYGNKTMTFDAVGEPVDIGQPSSL
ncbi:hypothetical protein Cob_v008977 [Colletotrichum orbiculare MAFF 240422]|uniref:Uncharacterized protein n=1 Tax=Colletotrichum orbiculare (strain 104-T / ATCC 96160 / CBS 514.97 / LARS 414 / MAFF 240422) TaxID=1213857 RepID=A0A484FKG2_COLOR|nr:hypothetical protein Cob_v008977 [Colletotrichum orbiculare MAFF 240422]